VHGLVLQLFKDVLFLMIINGGSSSGPFLCNDTVNT